MDQDQIVQALLGLRQQPVDDPIAGLTYPGAVPKMGASIPQQNVLGEQKGIAQGVTSDITSGLGELTQIPQAVKALKGEYTPDEAQMFALAAVPMLIGGAGGKIAREAATELGTAAAKVGGRAAAITANNLRNIAPEEAMSIAQSGAHIIPKKDGGYVGAPSWVKSPADLQAMRDNFDSQVREGLGGSDWYARAQGGIQSMAGLDPAAQSLAARELALTSAQATPDSNLGFALAGHNAYEAGTPPLIMRTGLIANTYNKARNAGVDIPLGKKTDVYAGHLDPTRENPNTGTNDIWHSRAFGYTNAEGQPWDSALTPQQHAFMDAETLLAVDRANKAGLNGRTDWSPGEIQAAPWVALKSKGLQQNFGWDKARADAEAAKTYPDFFNKYTAHGTYESTPGIGTGHLQSVATGSPELRAQYAADPRSSWIMPDQSGHDIMYRAMGAYQQPTVPATGVYQSLGGPLEINPANVARPLVGMTGAPGERTIDPASRSMLDTAEAARAYIDAQNAGAWSKPITGNKPGLSNSLFTQREGPLSIEQINALREVGAKYGLPDVIDYGRGTAMTNFAGGQDAKAMVDALKRGELTGQRAQMDTGYKGFEDALRAPQGTGAATRQLQEYMSNPTLVAKLDASPQLRQAAMNRFERDAEYAAKNGDVAREDIQNARQIIAQGGFAGLFKALGSGVALPAGLLPVLAGALREKRGE